MMVCTGMVDLIQLRLLIKSQIQEDLATLAPAAHMDSQEEISNPMKVHSQELITKKW